MLICKIWINLIYYNLYVDVLDYLTAILLSIIALPIDILLFPIEIIAFIIYKIHNKN